LESLRGEATTENGTHHTPETEKNESKTLTPKENVMKLSEIIIPAGRRDINHVKVSELAESIKIVGLINPITVGKDNTLITGAHRLEACRLLGFDEIGCVVLDCDDLRTELVEIDENLIRNDLDPISVGELALRRDEILEALGLRAKVGQGRPAKNGAVPAPLKTTESIAKESGISERTLQENKQLAKNLVPEAKEAVRQKTLPKSAALEISRLEPEKQREVIAKKDKKAIVEEIRGNKRQTSVGDADKPRRKTLAQDKDEAVDFAERYQQWLTNPAGQNTPVPEQNEKGILKLPLPLDHRAMYSAFLHVFGKENETIRNRVIAEIQALAVVIENLND
jgi:ParB family chromosome partitioning protein